MPNPDDLEYLDDTLPRPLYSEHELTDDFLNTLDAIDQAIDLNELALRAGHVH